eukprot:Opistho-2@56410
MDADGGQPHIRCAILDDKVRCERPATNNMLSNRVLKELANGKLKIALDSDAGHSRICQQHKMQISAQRKKDKPAAPNPPTGTTKGSKQQAQGTESADLEVDLNSLQVNALKRYKRHYKLATRHNMNKPDLVQAVMKHFKSQAVVENDFLTNFIEIVKSEKNKLDKNPALQNGGADD